MKRRVPRLRTDEAEAVLESDLSELDLSQFKSGRSPFRDGPRSKPKIASGMNPARQRAVEQLRQMVLDALGDRQAAVYLFGSHARGEVRHASDIDVAILPREELSPAFFALLADKIEESTIPYEVDLVDLREVSAAFRGKVVRSGIKWRD